MRRYLVTFHKVVSDDAGHDRRTLQRQVILAALSDAAAVEAAKAMFCEAAGIIDWQLRADAYEVIELVA